MAISLGWGSQSRPHDPDDHTRGMWEWPTKHTRVAKAPKAAKLRSAASARTARSASRLAWTSERTAYRTADDQDAARSSLWTRSRIPLMKRLDSCVPNFLAISIASLITTLGGASSRQSIS